MTLEKAKNWATIVSAIAIPIVLAIAGYFVQRQLADEGLRKDYVGIATGILKEDPSKQEPELRTWAVKVLDDNSPVPFSKRAKEGLLTGNPIVLPGPAWFGPPDRCRTASKARTVPSAFTKLTKDAPHMNQQQMLDRMQQFIELVIEEEANAAETAIKFKCLQEWATSEEQADIEYRKSIGAPSSKSIADKLKQERLAKAVAAASSGAH